MSMILKRVLVMVVSRDFVSSFLTCAIGMIVWECFLVLTVINQLCIFHIWCGNSWWHALAYISTCMIVLCYKLPSSSLAHSIKRNKNPVWIDKIGVHCLVPKCWLCVRCVIMQLDYSMTLTNVSLILPLCAVSHTFQTTL